MSFDIYCYVVLLQLKVLEQVVVNMVLEPADLVFEILENSPFKKGLFHHVVISKDYHICIHNCKKGDTSL